MSNEKVQTTICLIFQVQRHHLLNFLYTTLKSFVGLTINEQGSSSSRGEARFNAHGIRASRCSLKGPQIVRCASRENIKTNKMVNLSQKLPSGAEGPIKG
jgi:hypothetical protein